MTRKIAIFDTTLRDGEQSPGASMNSEEKLVITRQLLRLNVDVIEAAYPESSPRDLKSDQHNAAEQGERADDCPLTRAVEKDIDSAARALAECKRPRIHTGIGVSHSHIYDKLRTTPEKILERTTAAVKYAKKYVNDVEFYAEDAGRADYEFLAKVVEAAIAAGATVINIPDTTGYSLPDEFGRRIKYLMEHVSNMDKATLSVHCHNDLGLAVANSLEGIRAGARQVECTLNGLGGVAVLPVRVDQLDLGLLCIGSKRIASLELGVIVFCIGPVALFKSGSGLGIQFVGRPVRRRILVEGFEPGAGGGRQSDGRHGHQPRGEALIRKLEIHDKQLRKF